MTPAQAAAQSAQGANLVSNIKQVAVNPNSNVPAQQQQAQAIFDSVQAMQKGSNMSVLITNTHATDRQAFLLFDVCGIALAKGAAANGGDIEITSTFAGLGTEDGYECLRESIKGTHLGSVGTMFQFGSETYIVSANLNVWNGNLEDFNNKNLQNYLTLATDTYANDTKIRIMKTTLWLNNYLAISGSLPAGGTLEILFNVPVQSNF